MDSNRERILQRLRGATHSTPRATLPASNDAAIFANHPGHEDLIERFGAKLVTLKGEFFRVRDLHEAAARVRELLTAAAASSSACLRQRADLIDELVARDPWLQTHTTPLTHDLPNERFAQYEAGLTAADFLIARTGSIMLDAAGAGGRRLSVLPPLHIVIATAAQVVASLDEAFFQIKKMPPASYLTIITGPSRTSDIEKILVLGAHGPKRLAVIVLE
jgi:L-lactate dehydrogenase complex protein LldG